MPTKLRAKSRVRAATISGVLCAVAVLWVGCDGNGSPAKVVPPVPHRLGDVTLRGSEAPALLTPTAVVSPGPTPAHTPAATEATPEVGESGAPPPIEKNPGHAGGDSSNTTAGLPGNGVFTIQIGAYIIDKNLNHIRDKIASLGFYPYVKEMKQTMRMYCVIVGEGLSEGDARGTVSVLTARGFDARLLPGYNGTVDVTAGIYYYKDDALVVEGEVKALGYTPRVEARSVEVVLKRLRIGGYRTIGDAKKDLAVLQGKGYSPVILKSDQ